MSHLNKRIEKLETELKELKRIANKKESKRFVTKYGVSYWFLDGFGIICYIYNNDHTDNKIMERQKVFRTEEEAIKADNQRIAIKKCNDKVLDIIEAEYPNWVCDWSDSSQAKHYPVFDHSLNQFDVSMRHSLQTQLTFEHAPKGVWERIDKDLIKQAFGVE